MRICPATAAAEMSRTRRGIVREPFAKTPEEVNLWCFAKTQTMQKHQRLTFVVSRVSFCVVCCQLISRGFRIYPWEVNPPGRWCIMATPKGEMTTWPSEMSIGPSESQRTSSPPHFIPRFPPCYFLPKYHLDCLIILMNHVQEDCFCISPSWFGSSSFSFSKRCQIHPVTGNGVKSSY